MRLQAYDDNGTMKFRQVSGSQALDSLPVGTTIGYVGGVIPNGYLEADGSTFDTAKYPELYSKLGSNTLPELFDHSSQIRYDLASSFSSSVWYTAPKDGVILGNCQGPFTNAFSIYLRAPGGTTNISARQLMLYNDYNSNTWGSGSSLPISKGWQVYVESEDASTCYFAPYDKHLLIKAATIGISDIDINTIKNSLSYSTEETLTGGTWIDGKPIYRKVIPAFRNGSWTSNWSITQANYYYNPTDIPTYIDTLVNARAQSLRTDGWYDSMSQVDNKGLTININTQTMWAIWPTAVSKADIILEYTKQ